MKVKTVLAALLVLSGCASVEERCANALDYDACAAKIENSPTVLQGFAKGFSEGLKENGQTTRCTTYGANGLYSTNCY